MARRLTLPVFVLALAACATTPPVTGVAGAASPSPERAQELLAMQARADAAYSDGRNAEAVELYTALAKVRPADATYWYRLGNALVRTGAYADAGFAYRRTVVLEPGNSRAWHNLGVVHMHLAQESLAEAVKHAGRDKSVFDESLKLSAGLYSLVGTGALPESTPTEPRPAPDDSALPAPAAGDPMPDPAAGRQP